VAAVVEGEEAVVAAVAAADQVLTTDASRPRGTAGPSISGYA
jgi:hypothetical protein